MITTFIFWQILFLPSVYLKGESAFREKVKKGKCRVSFMKKYVKLCFILPSSLYRLATETNIECLWWDCFDFIYRLYDNDEGASGKFSRKRDTDIGFITRFYESSEQPTNTVKTKSVIHVTGIVLLPFVQYKYFQSKSQLFT